MCSCRVGSVCHYLARGAERGVGVLSMPRGCKFCLLFCCVGVGIIMKDGYEGAVG